MDLSSYISGYIDGEGCFCVSFQPSKHHALGWEVRPSFSVSQNKDRSELLFELQRNWKCGSIRPDRSDNTLKYEVRNISELVERVIPHFKQYPLFSSKQRDVELFEQVCLKIYGREHREPSTFARIVEIAM